MKIKSCYTLIVLLWLCITVAPAQTIPSPKSFFGFNIGDDYKLTNYTSTAA